MCLKLSEANRKSSQYKIATEDISCYKVVKSHGDRFYTPYFRADAQLGQTYYSEFTFNHYGDVSRGLHSFKSLKAATAEADSFIANTKIIRCVIPKGSRYYQGKFGNAISYASDTLTYLEII